jgi:hypothetical protein
MHIHAVKDILFDVIVGCSIAHTLLPPWDGEAMKPFPRLQRSYRLFIYVIGYIAINARSTVYKSISMNNPDGLNANPPMDPPAEK